MAVILFLIGIFTGQWVWFLLAVIAFGLQKGGATFIGTWLGLKL